MIFGGAFEIVSVSHAALFVHERINVLDDDPSIFVPKHPPGWSQMIWQLVDEHIIVSYWKLTLVLVSKYWLLPFVDVGVVIISDWICLILMIKEITIIQNVHMVCTSGFLSSEKGLSEDEWSENHKSNNNSGIMENRIIQWNDSIEQWG